MDTSAVIRTDAGQVVLAYLQSGFPFQGIRGTYRIKHLFSCQRPWGESCLALSPYTLKKVPQNTGKKQGL